MKLKEKYPDINERKLEQLVLSKKVASLMVRWSEENSKLPPLEVSLTYPPTRYIKQPEACLGSTDSTTDKSTSNSSSSLSNNIVH